MRTLLQVFRQRRVLLMEAILSVLVMRIFHQRLCRHAIAHPPEKNEKGDTKAHEKRENPSVSCARRRKIEHEGARCTPQKDKAQSQHDASMETPAIISMQR